MRIYLLIPIAILAGCSIMPGTPRPLQPQQWLSDTKPMSEFERDEYECRRDNPSARRGTAAQLRDQCMKARGWRRI